MTFCTNLPGHYGYGMPVKTSGATLPTTFIKSFLSWYAVSPTKKSKKSTSTASLNGGQFAYLYGYFTATENKDFTGTSANLPTPYPITYTKLLKMNMTKTNLSGKFQHSTPQVICLPEWHMTTTAATGMCGYCGSNTQKSGQLNKSQGTQTSTSERCKKS